MRPMMWAWLFLAGCGDSGSVPATAPAPSGAAGAPAAASAPASPAAAATGEFANLAAAQVTEVLHGDGRTYLHVTEAEWDFWASVPHLDVAVGDYVLLGRGPEKHAFKSMELDRDFDRMVVIEQVQKTTLEEASKSLALAPPDGGVTIAAVFDQRHELAGKPVAVRGRIVKANVVFGHHWYHLEDGSGTAEAKNNNLTITADSEHAVGDVVTARGSLTIDKDLGFGYFYPAIIELAEVTASP